MAIPGFLQMTEDQDYVLKERIAQGGFGAVYHAELTQQSASETQVVAKRSFGKYCFVECLEMVLTPT